jgi:hypothetical protein
MEYDRDPLSPFQFDIVVEGLRALFEGAYSYGYFKEIGYD